jgi:hypothetical protein
MSATDVKCTLGDRDKHNAADPDGEAYGYDDDVEEEDSLFSTQVTFSCAKAGGAATTTTYRFELAVRKYDGTEASSVSGRLFVATPTASSSGIGVGASESGTTPLAKKTKMARVGMLEGYLVERPCSSFYAVCDNISAELQQISTTFFEYGGRVLG